MTPKEIKARIFAAVQPQLDALEAHHDRLMPMSARVIGKHHPEYDTVPGRVNNITRRLRLLLGDAWKLNVPAGRPRVGLMNRLEVQCPNRGCTYEDSGYDYALIMTEYRKHRHECGSPGAPAILAAV